MLHGTFVDSFKLRLTDLIYLIRSYICIAKYMFRHLIFFNMVYSLYIPEIVYC